MAREFKVGDPVRGYEGQVVIEGKVDLTYRPNFPGGIYILSKDGTYGPFHPKQCRHLKRKRPQSEPPKRRRWVIWKGMGTEQYVVGPKTDLSGPGTKVVEVREGEIVCSEEQLAKAWDETVRKEMAVANSSDSFAFGLLLKALRKSQ